MRAKRTETETVDAGSGDVLVDLGFPDAGERKLPGAEPAERPLPAGPVAVLAGRAGAPAHGRLPPGAVAAHGAAGLLQEFQRFGNSKFDMYICRGCGQRAIYNDSHENPNKHVYDCLNCKQQASIACIPSNYIANSTLTFIQNLNIDVKLNPEPFKIADYDYGSK